MEPAAPSSPDPSPQEHHSPAPSPANRSPWKKQPAPASNGVVDAPPPAVIDTNHWPLLSEAAKAKFAAPPPADSPKPLDPAPPAAAAASSAIANPSNSPKHGSGAHHGRQKTSRRGGGGGGGGGGDQSPRDHHERGAGGWDHANGGGRGGGRGGQRNHNNGGGRRGGGNSSPGGGVAHHGGGFGGPRRGGFEGNYRGPSMGMGPYMRGAPPPPPPLAVAPQFMAPPPPPVSHMRPFPGQIMYHEMPSPMSPVSPMYFIAPAPPPEALRGMPFAPPMPGPPPYPYFQPLDEPEADADAEDRAKLLQQIEFYFSKDNLCTDVYLRRNMDDQGWVDVTLIAGFKKVKALTDDVNYIKETIQSSSVLEIQGDKIRRRIDWDKWLIPRESNPDFMSSSAAVPNSHANNLTAHFGGMGLHESASSSTTVDQNHHDILPNGSASVHNHPPAVEDNAGHR